MSSFFTFWQNYGEIIMVLTIFICGVFYLLWFAYQVFYEEEEVFFDDDDNDLY